MATDRSKRRAWTLGVVVVAILTVLALTGGVLAGLRSAANVVVTPFNWTVNEIARPIGHLFAGAINYSDVVAQNQKLRYELGQAELKANEEWSLERQLQQLSTSLKVPYVGSLPTVAVEVTTLSPTNFAATAQISKGRNSGILVGMPVVANGGLVGSIVATTSEGATVRLITDVNSAVGVTFGDGATSLVVSGRGVNNGMSATSVPLATPITPGTRLATNGLNGGLYPPGLPVAKVAQVSLTPGAATYNLILRPTADLRHLQYLDVVLWEPTP